VLNAFTQDIQITSRTENIQINCDSSFTRHITVLLKKCNDWIVYPVFYDHELEEVSDFKVFTRKGRRYKLNSNPVILEKAVKFGYISSKRVKSVVIPPDTDARIEYTLTCNELLYFTGLPLFSYDETDTLKYQLAIPEDFWFSHSIIHADSLEYLSIDSLKTDGMMKWFIEVRPRKVEPDLLTFFGFYRNIKVPLVRTIVVPAAYKNLEREFLNNWYLSKLETRRGLDSTTISVIEKLTFGITDQMMILETIYQYVQSNFKYVSIQIGMGAFIPVHANEVFVTKQGDCKALSIFLSEALNHKGIKSHLALAATYEHVSDCDFPSLGSANHVICVAWIDDEQIILDPTDPVHFPKMPVQSLQERTIFITGVNGGEYHKIAGLPPVDNKISYEIDLKANSDQKFLKGRFKAVYEGLSGNYLRHAFLNIGEDRISGTGKKHYESVFNSLSITAISIDNNRDSVVVKGEIPAIGEIFNDDGNQYLFIDFLPRLIESEKRETLLKGTFIGNTIHKTVKLRIELDELVESLKPIERIFSSDGVSLTLSISMPADYLIEIEYDFVLEHIFIEKENINNVNQILKDFKKVCHEPIILKKQN
jgi:hypothetical protein